MLAIGTTCADLISYVLGHFGKTSVQTKYPEIHRKIDYFLHNKQKWVLPGIFIYSAFIPFPNELVMLPLGLMGYKLRKVIVPLLIGTAVNTTIFTLGFSSVFNLFFE
jgi:membrane protein DedA with SNARE-associated domain